MKKIIALLLIVTLILAILLTSCNGVSETQTPIPGGETPNSAEAATSEPTSIPMPTIEPTPSPTPSPEPSPAKVQLLNGSDSTGNTHFASPHYGLHITYGNDLISIWS